MGSKRVTLADVARLAGMSVASASMILNDRPGTRLSDDARDRIRAAAEELGYRPNIAARGLRTSRTNTIGFISDLVSVTRFASGQIRGALRAAEAADHVVLVIETGDSREREERAVEAMLDRQVDGIIFAARSAREVDLPPVPQGTRFVLLNVTHQGVPGVVQPAEYEGGRTAVRAIAEAGHREGIVLVGQNRRGEGDAKHSQNVIRRIEGIRAEMAARGLAFEHEIAARTWVPESGYAVVSSYLAEGHRPRCLLVLNDPLAFGAYQALSEYGLRVPDDVSVIGFDDDEIAGYMRPGLTTVALPYEEMGEAAVRMLLSGQDRTLLVAMPLVVRGSLQPPAQR
jgi:LacI family transcriptional regulator